MEEARLGRLKTEAQDRFASGRLSRDEHPGSFLTHAAEARRLLQGLAERVDQPQSGNNAADA